MPWIIRLLRINIVTVVRYIPFTKGAKTIHEERIVFSTNGVRTTRYPHAKKNEVGPPTSHSIQKLTHNKSKLKL